LIPIPPFFTSKYVRRTVVLVGLMALLGCCGFVASLRQSSIDKIQQTMLNAVPFDPSRVSKSTLDIQGEYIRTKDGKFRIAEKEHRNTDLPTMRDVNNEVEEKELRNVIKELITKNPGKFDAELKKYTDKEEFKKHMELVKSVNMKMKEEDEHLQSRLDDTRKEEPLKKAAARVANKIDSQKRKKMASTATAQVSGGKARTLTKEVEKPIDPKKEQFDRLKAELLRSVEKLTVQQAKDKEVHERAIANQPASARATAEEAFDHKQQDAMTRLKRTNDEKLDALRNKLWPPKLHRRLTTREKRANPELEEITKKRIELLEKSLGTTLSDDLTYAVNSLPKTLESYDDETRMCRYLNIGCTGQPTSFPTYIDPTTNLPGKGLKGELQSEDDGEDKNDGEDEDDGKGDWGLEPGDNPIIQNSTNISSNTTDEEDNKNRMTEEERKKEIIEAYEEELQNEDKGVVLADKQEERENRIAAKKEWLKMHHELKKEEEDKQEADQKALKAIVDEKHAEEQELHDSHVTKLNERKKELIQAHNALQEKNEEDLKAFRIENQKKLNEKRSELYPGYTPPDGQPQVEESIIYVHNDDDDGDDDDYDVSEDDDYDAGHSIDDADGGDLPVAESGSLTNETEVPRSSMGDMKPQGDEDESNDVDEKEENEEEGGSEEEEGDDDGGDDEVTNEESEGPDEDKEEDKDEEVEDEDEEDGESLSGDKEEEGVESEDGKSHDGDGEVEEVGKNHDGDDYIDPDGKATSSGDDDGYYDDDTKARAAKLAQKFSSSDMKKQSKGDKKKMLKDILSELGAKKRRDKKNMVASPCKGSRCREKM